MEKQLDLDSLSLEEAKGKIQECKGEITLRVIVNDRFIESINSIFKEILNHSEIKEVLLDMNKWEITDEKSLYNLHIFFLKYFKNIIGRVELDFTPFDHKQLMSVLSFRYYLELCALKGLDPIWEEEILKKAQEKLERYQKELKEFREEINLLKDYQREIPFSFFSYYSSERWREIIFRFSLTTSERKRLFIEICEGLGISKDNFILKYLDNSHHNSDIFDTGIGKSYDSENVLHHTLYFWFDNIMKVEKNTRFIEELTGIDVEVDCGVLSSVAFMISSQTEEVDMVTFKSNCSLDWVVPDEELFSGKYSLLKEVFNVKNKEVLRREYIIDRSQLTTLEENKLKEKGAFEKKESFIFSI